MNFYKQEREREIFPIFAGLKQNENTDFRSCQLFVILTPAKGKGSALSVIYQYGSPLTKCPSHLVKLTLRRSVGQRGFTKDAI